MPMLDCTSNDAILEAMSCGAPVMSNRVGGIPEYLDAGTHFITDGKNVDDWVQRLRALAADRDGLRRRRPAARANAERFDWRRVATLYRELYRDIREQ
jgi:glycosyltransferase involved in cell wall biosynthesis